MRNVEQVIRAFCRRAIEEKETLTSLDQAVGNGDFGVNLERGAVAVLAALDQTQIQEPTNQLLSRLAMTLNSAGCGTCGTFIPFGMLAGAVRSDEPEAFLEAALAKIMK